MSKRLHPLTEELWGEGYFDLKKMTEEKMDSLIRSYLDKKAKELRSKPYELLTTAPIERILGLSEPEAEKKTKMPCHPDLHPLTNVYGFPRCKDCGNLYDPKPKPSEEGEGGEWECEYCKAFYPSQQVFCYAMAFCGFCGTPRPIAKQKITLEEKLIEWHKKCDETSTAFDLTKKAAELATIIRAHFSNGGD